MREATALFEAPRGWQVLQPAIYLISIVPVLWLWCAAPSVASLPALILAGLGVVAMQHAVNVFNDENDWRRGADSEKMLSWVRFHGFDLSTVRRHGWLSFAGGLTVGIAALALQNRLWILPIALLPVGLGLWYNFGRHPLAYSRWGESVTGFCYGVGVFGCLWLLSPSPSAWSLLFGITGCGALSISVLLAHQPSQILTDAAAGKRTYAVVHGAAQTRRRAVLCYLVAVLALCATFSTSPLPFPVKVAAMAATLATGHLAKTTVAPGRFLLGITLPLLFGIALLIATGGQS